MAQVRVGIEHLADAVWVFNHQGIIVDVNHKAVEELGYSKEELLGMSITEIDPTLNEIGFGKYLEYVIEKGMISYEGQSIRKNGEVIDIKASGTTQRVNDELIYISTTRNVTAEKLKNKALEEANRALKRSEERMAAIINMLPDLLFIYDAEGYFVDCIANEMNHLLLPKSEFIGRNLSDIMSPEIAERGKQAIKLTLSDNQVQRFEYPLEVNQQVMYYETRMVKSSDNEVLAIVRDITALKNEQNLILDLSYKDHLTGLYNRRYLDELMERDQMSAVFPMTIMMIDVNGLKLTNDAFGHLTGDELLRRVAYVLKEVCPERALISRIGGDEFVVVIQDFSSQMAEYLVDKLHKRIVHEKVKEVSVSVSIGWDTRLSESDSLRDAFIRAENIMFRKKLIESQSMRNETVKAIIGTLNEKSEREKRHSEQVAQISRKIGEALGFNEQMLKEIEMTGLLHDIGKIVIHDEILNKPGKLTVEEYDEIKRHPESGYQILKSVDQYSSMADVILAHHERYDGKGYPRGIKGKDIPLVARIITVADAYEAMVSDRAYRKGMGHEQAVSELKKHKGTQFDPMVVHAFLEVMG